MSCVSYLFDSSALLHRPELLDELEGAKYISSYVLEELDGLKNLKGGYLAREAIRKLSKANVQYLINDCPTPTGLDPGKIDNKLLWLAQDNGYTLVTCDYALQIKAKGLGVPVYEIPEKTEIYTGIKELVVEENLEKLANIYEKLHENQEKLLINQYLTVKKKSGEFLDVLKWNGEKLVSCKSKTLNSKHFGKVKPYDVYQQCLIDSLLNNQMTLVKGKAGSGKTYLSLAYAMGVLEKDDFNKIIIVSNPIKTRNSSPIGFLPGSKDEKLLESSLGSMLLSKLGDRSNIDKLIAEGKLLLLPFSDLRGFDTTGLKAIVYISEAQNADISMLKLAIQRAGEDSKVIIDGDVDSQVDSSAYEGKDSGMRRVSEIFRGQAFYGEVQLPIIYRSRMAAVADQM
jgi:predicted ribonuclease YlaK